MDKKRRVNRDNNHLDKNDIFEKYVGKGKGNPFKVKIKEDGFTSELFPTFKKYRDETVSLDQALSSMFFNIGTGKQEMAMFYAACIDRMGYSDNLWKTLIIYSFREIGYAYPEAAIFVYDYYCSWLEEMRRHKEELSHRLKYACTHAMLSKFPLIFERMKKTKQQQQQQKQKQKKKGGGIKSSSLPSSSSSSSSSSFPKCNESFTKKLLMDHLTDEERRELLEDIRILMISHSAFEGMPKFDRPCSCEMRKGFQKRNKFMSSSSSSSSSTTGLFKEFSNEKNNEGDGNDDDDDDKVYEEIEVVDHLTTGRHLLMSIIHYLCILPKSPLSLDISFYTAYKCQGKLMEEDWEVRLSFWELEGELYQIRKNKQEAVQQACLCLCAAIIHRDEDRAVRMVDLFHVWDEIDTFWDCLFSLIDSFKIHYEWILPYLQKYKEAWKCSDMCRDYFIEGCRTALFTTVLLFIRGRPPRDVSSFFPRMGSSSSSNNNNSSSNQKGEMRMNLCISPADLTYTKDYVKILYGDQTPSFGELSFISDLKEEKENNNREDDKTEEEEEEEEETITISINNFDANKTLLLSKKDKKEISSLIRFKDNSYVEEMIDNDNDEKYNTYDLYTIFPWFKNKTVKSLIEDMLVPTLCKEYTGEPSGGFEPYIVKCSMDFGHTREIGLATSSYEITMCSSKKIPVHSPMNLNTKYIQLKMNKKKQKSSYSTISNTKEEEEEEEEAEEKEDYDSYNLLYRRDPVLEVSVNEYALDWSTSIGRENGKGSRHYYMTMRDYKQVAPVSNPYRDRIQLPVELQEEQAKKKRKEIQRKHVNNTTLTPLTRTNENVTVVINSSRSIRSLSYYPKYTDSIVTNKNKIMGTRNNDDDDDDDDDSDYDWNKLQSKINEFKNLTSQLSDLESIPWYDPGIIMLYRKIASKIISLKTIIRENKEMANDSYDTTTEDDYYDDDDDDEKSNKQNNNEIYKKSEYLLNIFDVNANKNDISMRCLGRDDFLRRLDYLENQASLSLPLQQQQQQIDYSNITVDDLCWSTEKSLSFSNYGTFINNNNNNNNNNDNRENTLSQPSLSVSKKRKKKDDDYDNEDENDEEDKKKKEEMIIIQKSDDDDNDDDDGNNNNNKTSSCSVDGRPHPSNILFSCPIFPFNDKWSDSMFYIVLERSTKEIFTVISIGPIKDELEIIYTINAMDLMDTLEFENAFKETCLIFSNFAYDVMKRLLKEKVDIDDTLYKSNSGGNGAIGTKILSPSSSSSSVLETVINSMEETIKEKRHRVPQGYKKVSDYIIDKHPLWPKEVFLEDGNYDSVTHFGVVPCFKRNNDNDEGVQLQEKEEEEEEEGKCIHISVRSFILPALIMHHHMEQYKESLLREYNKLYFIHDKFYDEVPLRKTETEYPFSINPVFLRFPGFIRESQKYIGGDDNTIVNDNLEGLLDGISQKVLTHLLFYIVSSSEGMYILYNFMVSLSSSSSSSSSSFATLGMLKDNKEYIDKTKSFLYNMLWEKMCIADEYDDANGAFFVSSIQNSLLPPSYIPVTSFYGLIFGNNNNNNNESFITNRNQLSFFSMEEEIHFLTIIRKEGGKIVYESIKKLLEDLSSHSENNDGQDNIWVLICEKMKDIMNAEEGKKWYFNLLLKWNEILTKWYESFTPSSKRQMDVLYDYYISTDHSLLKSDSSQNKEVEMKYVENNNNDDDDIDVDDDHKQISYADIDYIVIKRIIDRITFIAVEMIDDNGFII
jgi:hypothetical protein